MLLNWMNRSNLDKNIVFIDDLCFNYSFKKPNNLKEIYNAWDIFIDWSINIGNSHIAFTINFPNNKEKYKEIDMFTNILKMHPVVKNTKNYFDYILLKDWLFCDASIIKDYFASISLFNKLITWEYFTTEENENGVLHLHGIIAYRNIIDYNKNIKNNILNNIKKKFVDCDIVLKDLNKFKDIKGWVQYLHKDKILIFPPKFDIIEKYIQKVKEIFIGPYLNNYNLKNNFISSRNNIDAFLNICILDCFYEQPDIILNFRGIILKKNELNENIFIDLILNYLTLKNYYIYNDTIYRKIKKSLISYEKVGSIKEVLFDEFENNIVSYFTQTFPCQFLGFDFYFLIKTYKNQMEYNILKIKNLTTNKINLNFSYLEFIDGIYDITNNKFIKKESFTMLNIYSVKYYNKTYDWVRKIKPVEWIKGIKNALGEDNLKDFTTICLFIASFFQMRDENTKKNFLYIYGKTNTGKSTYLTKVLTRYFGSENIGTVVNSSNFKFQDLKDKILVIMDEFRYSTSSSSDFLKLLGGEPLLTTQKYSKNHITIDKLTGLILSNYIFFEKDENVSKALLERLYVIEFFNVNKNKIININEVLKEEEASIIIFCNKLYFSYYSKNYKVQKQIYGSKKDLKIDYVDINQHE